MLITPAEFERRMAELASMDDAEASHCKADDIMCQILTQLGYEAGVRIFEDMTRWYA